MRVAPRMLMFTKMLKAPALCCDWLFNEASSDPIDTVSKRRSTLFFISCVLFYALYLITLQPGWVLGGGMWAEMATNYYANANDSSILVKLFATDAGYIPLPQRLIAYVGNAFNLAPASIPYYYTWAGILLTGSMVGAFCLSPFRALIRNDYLRLFTSISVLLVADFETRTFINFTYFAAFFVAVLTALALVKKNEECPRWAWVIPVLMASKPAVMAIFPAMFVAALVSKTRFRLITVSVVGIVIVQLISTSLSHSAGAFGIVYNFTTLDKVIATGGYFIGLLGAFTLGKGVSSELYSPLWLGAIALGICIIVIRKKKTPANALILVGLSLLFFNVLLNAFALSDAWNINMDKLKSVPLYRHIIVGYFGAILVMAGLIDACFTGKITGKSKGPQILAPFIFVAWFILSGWFGFSGKANRSPEFPMLNSSQWQEMSSAIESSGAICVPIDPIGWIYSKNCSKLNPQLTLENGIEYRSLQARNDFFSTTLFPPQPDAKKNLLSFAVLARPVLSTAFVQGQAELLMKDGSIKYLSGSRQLDVSGSLFMFTGNGAVSLADIERITLKFNAPINIAFYPREPGDQAAVLWMGN